MTCFLCKGEMKQGSTTHVSEINNKIIIIKNVPCFKCSQCGETVYTGDVIKKLEQIIKDVENALTEIAILNYPNRVA